MAAAFAELGFTAVNKLSDRYHDRVYDKAGAIPRKLVRRSKTTSAGRKRSYSQPARQEVTYEYEEDGPGRARELKKEDWEVADDTDDRGRSHPPKQRMAETPYGRSGSTDAGYDQRAAPTYDNYSAPPQHGRAVQDDYARGYQGDMRNYDPAVAAAAGGAAAYASNYAPPAGHRSYDDYYRRGSDEYSYSNPDRRDPYDRRYNDDAPVRGSGGDDDRSHSRGRRERKTRRGDGDRLSRHRSQSQFRRVMDDNFDTSEKGAAAGLAGALVGGLAGKKFGDDSMLATLVGAAVGGIGANALEHQWRKRQDLKEGGSRKKDGHGQAYGSGYDDERYERRRRRSR
ncbi:MAG: hypothetical protein M1821_002091 [Bathelium mastoideum]|nr:MAG: hypothetical protein M1821_002091 [Bathelium mastoideum]KAI9692600.1 MAG: hypothetical protein M1822_006831 [Bathelium mastoideum]